MYYFLLSFASLLFASQFLFNQKFQAEYGDTLYSALLFTGYTSLISFFAMLAIGGFKAEITLFSVLVALVYSFVSISYSYVSIKAFNTVNLSVYSVFAMLGGMLLPFLYGVWFQGEPLTTGKFISCLLIVIALSMTVTKGSSGGGAVYYILVFLLNGLCGVISAFHQSNPKAVGSVSFMMLNRLMAVIICLAVWAIFFRKPIGLNKRGLIYSVGFALFCGFGNLIALVSLKFLPASVQYPIITGGVMAISLFISLIRREKVTPKNIISAAFAFAATIFVTM